MIQRAFDDGEEMRDRLYSCLETFEACEK
jgi:hypothetical protein